MTSGLAMRMRIELHQLMQRHGIEPAPVVLPLADPSPHPQILAGLAELPISIWSA